MLLTVVIPAYNEEKRITDTLTKINNFLSKRNYDFEVIVVDDGSTDDTARQVTVFSEKNLRFKLLQNNHNIGKGAAVQKGVLNANGDYILFTDADLSGPIEEIERLFFWLFQDYDVVFGSRNLYDPSVRVHSHLGRSIVHKIIGFFVRYFTMIFFEDTLCGFKAFKKDVAVKLFSHQKMMKYAFDFEILYLAVKANFRCKEVAINWKYSSDSRKKLFRDSFIMLKDLAKIPKLHKSTYILHNMAISNSPVKQLVKSEVLI